MPGKPLSFGCPKLSPDEKALSDISTDNQIGFGRHTNEQPVVSTSPSAIRLSVTSPGASLMRVAIEISVRGAYRITSFSPSSPTESLALEVMVEDTQITSWSPVTEGETQHLLVEPVGDGVGTYSLRVAKVSHLARLGFRNVQPEAKAFGGAASCQVDYKCVYDEAAQTYRTGLLDVRDAVAHMVYTKQDGLSYQCTGTLLNSANYPAPLFLTAYHCTDDASAVASLTTFWSYFRDVCDSGPPGPRWTQQPGGVISLALAPGLDASLLVLKQYPPNNAVYSGWDAKPVSPNTTIFTAHHPKGDVLKASFGSVVGNYPSSVTFKDPNRTFSPNTFHYVDWTIGIVEGGSSGASLFTYDPDTRDFYTRGTLTGGSASCNTTGPRTYYSRLELFFPYIEPLLNVKVPTDPSTATAVEYYNASLDHYFLTHISGEIATLDAGVTIKGWARTGQAFSVFTGAGSGTSPVCRYYIPPGKGDSHFYGRGTAECNATGAANPSFVKEDSQFFHVVLPTGGVCAAGLRSVYRVFSNRTDANHRYMVDRSLRDLMVTRGWAAEGDGPDLVVMCTK